jgi:competence protein ComGC
MMMMMMMMIIIMVVVVIIIIISIPGTTKRKTVVGLERGPLSLVSTTEELLDRKVAAPV